MDEIPVDPIKKRISSFLEHNSQDAIVEDVTYNEIFSKFNEQLGKIRAIKDNASEEFDHYEFTRLMLFLSEIERNTKTAFCCSLSSSTLNWHNTDNIALLLSTFAMVTDRKTLIICIYVHDESDINLFIKQLKLYCHDWCVETYMGPKHVRLLNLKAKFSEAPVWTCYFYPYTDKDSIWKQRPENFSQGVDITVVANIEDFLAIRTEAFSDGLPPDTKGHVLFTSKYKTSDLILATDVKPAKRGYGK